MRIVLASGCWDIVHIGHIRHLKMCKQMGTRLVVSVTRDRSVNKGPERPYMKQEARAEIIKSLRFVDQVILVDSSLEALKKVKPDIFAKGSEYRNRILVEDYEWCVAHDCEVRFTGKHIDSSTRYHDRIRAR